MKKNRPILAGMPTVSEIGVGIHHLMREWLNRLLDDPRFMTYVEPQGKRIRSALSLAGTLLLVSETAYWVYLGRTTGSVVPAKCLVPVTTAGVGAQTAEVGFFSTPAPPNAAAQVMTKIVATGTVAALTATGAKSNSTDFATSVAENTHLWAGLRTAMATTQPTCAALFGDMSQGSILSMAAATAFTGAGPWTGQLITFGGAQAPDLNAGVA